MTRKNLLKGLMEAAEKPDQAGTDSVSDAEPPAPPRYTKGAIGAVSRSIADLKSRSVVELDPQAIRDGGVADRLEHNEPDHAALVASIRDYGQQVPVLVRPHPEHDGQYQIVYGRRRVLALRDLGQPVKALIRDLDDRELVMAQGQENSARRDLSFIERVNFAGQMEAAGYDRKTIADALSTDKTLISRMLTVAESLPVELIEMVGAAPAVGRDRWLDFVDRWKAREVGPEDAEAMLLANPQADNSDERFEVLWRWLEGIVAPQKKPAPKVPKRKLLDAAGKAFGSVERGKAAARFELRDRAFADWLEDNITGIHRDWSEGRRGE